MFAQRLTFQRQSQKNYLVFALLARIQKNLVATVEKDFEIIQYSQLPIEEQYQNNSRIGWEKPKMLFIFFFATKRPLGFSAFFRLALRVAELGSLSSGAKMAMKIFIKRVFTIFTSNASFLRVIANLQI